MHKYHDNPGLPDALYNSLVESDYDRGTSKYSVSDLINPPQIVQLTRRHSDKLVKDARLNTHMTLGIAMHNLLEKRGLVGNTDYQLIERRLSTVVDGIEISGQPDIVCELSSDGIITDYKITKTNVVKYETKKAWIEQLNMYIWLLNKNDITVKRARIVAIFRDWDIIKKYFPSVIGENVFSLKANGVYPDWPIMDIPIDVWPDNITNDFIKQSLLAHEIAEALPDKDLPPCTDDDKWITHKYAVLRDGKVRASKLCDTIEQANEYISTCDVPEEYTISKRDGIPFRCMYNFCGVARICPQLKREGMKIVYNK